MCCGLCGDTIEGVPRLKCSRRSAARRQCVSTVRRKDYATTGVQECYALLQHELLERGDAFQLEEKCASLGNGSCFLWGWLFYGSANIASNSISNELEQILKEVAVA